MKSDIFTKVARIARTAGVPLRAVLLAGWICLMHRYTGQSDLVVGSRVSQNVPLPLTACILGRTLKSLCWCSSAARSSGFHLELFCRWSPALFL